MGTEANHADGWVICLNCGTIWRAVLQLDPGNYSCPKCYQRGALMVPDEYFYYSSLTEETEGKVLIHHKKK